ncbi:S-methyl-5'-thioadenosine phosphorylase [Dactylosporangium fulvum]|uniref:Purine nucleoside phosphorylase n=1 Tax=Dactylosporangium fulvum TaxID=53359 RepID=A0ABY5WE30_9ACTN|nr:S-methyl-5'-thioadenosine phosphorylase [Dactylosporangium fulvum]UWP87583.1 S-methyl-5'-thioadenosine phosphorylase [Dactylosporangium fulvum]
MVGGSGFYHFVDDLHEVEIDTPYGAPSDRLRVGSVQGRNVAFLARHGRDHRFPPHRINYRANMWALRSIGVQQVLAPCAVGSLRPDLGPGSLVIPDQIVDRTGGRQGTYFDEGAAHVSFADPYCPSGRAAVRAAAERTAMPAVDGGTMVVIDGPRFSTRAESRWYATQGWALVNMTGMPEAVLARELAMCYTSIALVTDVDAGVDAATAVNQAEVFRVFAEHTERLRALLRDLVADLEKDRRCPCPAALDGLAHRHSEGSPGERHLVGGDRCG